MKTSKVILLGALAAAGIYAISKSGVLGGDAEAPGSLGGEDDNSLTNDNNPFAKIDPNYQYPTGPEYFEMKPDGSVTPTTPELPWYDPVGPINPPPQNVDAYDTVNPSGMKWYDNPFLQGAALVTGGIAAEGIYRKGKDLLKKPQTEQLLNEGKIKSEIKEKTATEKINERVGFKERMPETEIVKARTLTDNTYKDPIKITEKAVAPKEFSVKTKFRTAEKVGAKAGAVLMVAQAGSSIVEQWKETKPQNVGEASGVVAAGSTNYLSDTFAFATGLVYRPKTKAERYSQGNTGWFASWQDLYDLGAEQRAEGTPIPLRVAEVLGVQGYFNKPKQSSNERVSVGPATNIDVRAAINNQIMSPISNAPSTPTQINVQTKKSSGGSSNKQVTYQNPVAVIKSGASVSAANKSLSQSGVSPTSPHNAATKAKAAQAAVKASNSYKKYF